MPYLVTWRDAGTYIRFYGHVTVDDVFAADDEQQNDIRFPDISYQLADFTDAESTSATLSDAKLPAAFDAAASQLNLRLKVALVARKAFSRQICEEYISVCTALNAPWQVTLFDNYDDAFQWCQE